MKFNVGDIILVKDFLFPPRPSHRQQHFRFLLRLHVRLHLKNTLGIITKVEKHSDLFEKVSTENDNGYIWYSQVDQKEYYFYQDEIDGEVIV